ncbi:transglycosylase SLT domain-containing protein [Polaromonas sp.]|uniref:transglycosylase SLT domain-containing protein n=1 Tax=Polaromonas sp. TaxID=1869339 RepID=UPI002488E0D0|nr:transglycosylase SLT domain-containing protein [Polaromonas sp.]MDI1342143.1 transglycosylase SLT domain-containing protein [Polaromonas sp.]
MTESQPAFFTHSAAFPASPVFSDRLARLLSPLRILALSLAALVLAGCASSNSKLGMPGDPVLGTSPSASQSVYPSGPLSPISAAQTPSSTVASLQPPADLWERIRRGFAMPNLEGELVADREQWYASRPDYIQRMTERSSKYLFHIVEELERRNMPTELALLPYIESAFNPQAVSSAKAAGMWQFMPATGKYFDLKQNAFRDDRRDVLASTRAALDYLQKLHGMFGDWHLALAAYNWGEGSVGRAIARNKKDGLGTSYQDLRMPDETRLYVPKLQAVKNIVANPQNFRAELPLIENHPYFQQVQITRDIDVALAAKLADVEISNFKALNPSAHRPVILAAGMPHILLPWDNAKIFQRNFEAYSQGQYASWTAWTAPATLSVSDAARRVGMSESDLRGVNNIPPRMLIKAGSTLMVSRSAKMDNDVTSQVADTAQLTLAPEIVTRRTTVKARKGETVASIARRYGLRPDAVAEWNKVGSSAAFKLGHQVVLFLPVKAVSAARPNAGKTKIQAVRRAPGKAVVKTKRH